MQAPVLQSQNDSWQLSSLATTPTVLSSDVGGFTNATRDEPNCQLSGWKCLNGDRTAHDRSGGTPSTPGRNCLAPLGANLQKTASPVRRAVKSPPGPAC